MVLQNLARTKSIRAGLYSSIPFIGRAHCPSQQLKAVSNICSTYTSAVARLPHFPGILYTIAGQVKFGVRVIQGLLLIYNRYPKFFLTRAYLQKPGVVSWPAWKIIVYVLKNNQRKRSRQEKIFRQNAVEKERHEIRPSSEIVYIIVCTLFYVNMVSFNTNVSSCNATSRMFVVCTKNYRIWACRR